MLVYGDRVERADPRERLEEIAEQLARVAAMPAGVGRHAKLVGALIGAGQVLQGVIDADFGELGQDRRTDGGDALTGYLCRIAHAVCRSWDSEFAEIGELPLGPALGEVPHEIELRTPEGFAYYAVYPEAYIEAARRLKLVGSPRVIGIRSIGTTLAAVVTSALDAPRPVTLRPHGDSFARKVRLAPEVERQLLAGEPHYVIVDEGPGQSGSSFGAVADWLEQRRVPLERIAFMPSHSGAPGSHASEAHRRRWSSAQRVTADLGERLPQLLQSWAALEAAPADISAGEWRRHVYTREEDWPAAVPHWERRKFLAMRNGEKVLLKFAGLGAIGERKFAMARVLHAAGLTAEPIDLVHGFTVERWCEGQRLGAGDKPMVQIAHYIAARPRLFPSDPDSGASVEQLFAMVRRNVSLALGDCAAESLESWSPRLDVLSRRVVRACTDNKLDRHEWLRLADGRLLKADALDHHAAHDLVGCQDPAWDVAGAIAEFGLDCREKLEFVEMVEQASGRAVDRELLEFCRVAYTSFRLGRAKLAAQMQQANDPEGQRLNAAASNYSSQLRDLLRESSCVLKAASLAG